jgi:hypothetical protein
VTHAPDRARAIARHYAGREINMHSFTYRGFNTGPPLDRKPVWILLTALVFAVIGLVMAYGITLPPGVAPLALALDTLAPSGVRPQFW